MKHWILTILALTIAACGGGGGGGGDEPEQSSAPVNTTSTNTGGSSNGGSTGGSTGSSGGFDFCHPALPVSVCDDDDSSGGSGGSTASSVHSQISDTEPNDDLANAVVVHWPRTSSADQRIGFGVEGAVNGVDDVADFFAFTPRRSADFFIKLCESEQLCGPNGPDHGLPVTTATVRILDQFGVEIFSEEQQPGSANLFATRFESGMLYYAVVVAEGTVGVERSYRLVVGESIQQTAGDAAPTPVPGDEEPTPVPGAPLLSAYVVDSNTNVQFDWTPATQNEDGTQLTDLAGFNLYLYDYVREGDSAERVLIETINDPSVMTRTINLEGYRDWYVSITAFNEAGIESAHSNGVELVDAPE
jgi:hypothetical protein